MQFWQFYLFLIKKFKRFFKILTMKNSIKKIALYSLLYLCTMVGSHYAYKFYFEEIIQEYFREKVVERIKQNLENHEDEFEQLVEFSKNFNEIDGLEFLENDTIDFRLHSLSLGSYNSRINYESIWLIERNDSVFYKQQDLEILVENFEFDKENSVSIFLRYGNRKDIYKLDNWTIHYKGNTNSFLLKKLLTYRNINFNKFLLLREKVKRLNCHYFEKNNGILTLYYAGNAPNDYFAYKINVSHGLSMKKYNLIKKNYYWHYQPSSLCFEITNWHREGEVD